MSATYNGAALTLGTTKSLQTSDNNKALVVQFAGEPMDGTYKLVDDYSPAWQSVGSTLTNPNTLAAVDSASESAKISLGDTDYMYVYLVNANNVIVQQIAGFIYDGD